MDDFQKRFPRTVAMVESRIAAQNTMESARHIHQQPQPESVTPCDDCEYYGFCGERPFNKSRGCRLRYAE